MDNLFGISEKALQVTEDRAVMITNNLANSSTPGYKARDIDFNSVMKNIDNTSGQLTKTSSAHISGQDEIAGGQLMYRIPMQKSLDGNTVDPEIERKNFLQNSLRYQVGLSFIQNKTDQLMKAIKGD